jgi:hypothetical protein
MWTMVFALKRRRRPKIEMSLRHSSMVSNSPGKEKEDLLKNYNAGKTNKNVIRNKAVSINAAVRAKAAQRQGTCPITSIV